MAKNLQDDNVVYYGSVLTKGLKPLGEVSNYYLAKHGIIQQSIIYPASVFNTHAYNLQYKSSADYALNIECFGDKNLTFQYLDYVIAKFNHTGVSGSSRDMVFEKDKPLLILKNFGFGLWLRYIVRKLRGKP